MAPSSLVSAAASLWTKCFSVYSCTATLASASRGTSFLATSAPCVRWLSTTTSAPPKRPLNAYMRYVLQQQPIMVRLHPEIKSVDVIRKIAQQWRTLSPDQKRPFEEASLKAREQFKVDLQRYMSQLTPAQERQLVLDRKQRLTKRKAIRKKRELTSLGKPKRPRSPFNIYMSEHFEEARGATTPAKMKSLLQDWRNLFSHQKQVYTQLAEDDKIRYKNEMKSWEEHMVEIGRSDLLREQTLSTKAKKAAPKTKKKTVKRATSKARTVKKKTKSSPSKTVKTSKKT